MPPRRRPAAPLAAAAALAAVLPLAGAPAFAHSGPRHAADETSPTLDAYTDVKPVFRTVANDVLAFYDETRSKRN